jgi:Lysophospholipase L1 and related esterases
MKRKACLLLGIVFLLGVLIPASIPLQASAASSTINDTDSGITYGGSGWSYGANRGVGDYGDDIHSTTGNDDYFQFIFSGTGIYYVTETSSSQGNVDIYIDNVYQTTLNCNSSWAAQQTVYAKTGLTPGIHTIKGVKKSGTYMIVDALKVIYGTLTINDNNTGITYGGSSWFYDGNRGSGDYNDDVHATTNNGDYLQYSFIGTGIDYITETSSAQGNVDVYMDDIYQTTVHCNSNWAAQQTVYHKTGLTLGTIHTIKLVKKSGTYMIVDALKLNYVTSSPNDDDSLITYSGSNWCYLPNRGVGDYLNDVHATTNNGDYFQFGFTGTGIDYVTETSSAQGNVDIYIDDVYQTTVNCNASWEVQQVVYSKTGLAPGTHTIKGVKESGTYMVVDRLQVHNALGSIADDYDGSIAYAGGTFGNSTSEADCLNNTSHWTSTANAYVEFSFMGNSIQYIGSKSTDHGYVDIYIDDVLDASNIDTYGPNRVCQYEFYSKSWVTSGPHKIKVVCKNQKNSNSTSIGFDLDVLKYTCDPEETAMLPLWQGNTTYNESVLMYSGSGLQTDAAASLFFTPVQILSVKNSRLDMEYIEGVDWQYTNGQLKLLPGSRIPYMTQSQMYPSTQGATLPKVGGGYVIYQEDSFFHDRQIVVTYTHAQNAWAGPVPSYGGSHLPNTMSKLNSGAGLKLVLYGDSISVGANASGWIDAPPYLPIWGQQVANELHKQYGSNITFVNPSIGGKDSVWGKDNVGTLVTSQNPDLVIVAFGMNDGALHTTPSAFKTNIATIIDNVRGSNPNTEFILVGTTLANSETYLEDQQPNYLAVLDQLASERSGIITANMTGVHQQLLQYKNFRDMTSNNANHPNDFLSRWYAQFIKGLLMQ